MSTKNIVMASAGGIVEVPSYWIAETGRNSGSHSFNASAIFDSTNNVYAAAFGYDAAGNNEFNWIIKRNADGAFIWQKKLFQTNSSNATSCIHLSSDGGVLFDWAGGGFGKITSDGNKVFYKYLSGASPFLTRLYVDQSENMYLVGTTNYNKFYVAKLDSSGSILWQKEHTVSGATSNNGYPGAVIDSSGNIYHGNGFYVSTTEYACITKRNSSGALQWMKSYTVGSYPLTMYNYALTSDNNYVYCVCGYGASTNKQAVLLKLNSSGSVVWSKQVASAEHEWFYNVTLDSNGNVYALGQNTQSGTGIKSTLVFKFDSSGTLQWQRQINNTRGHIVPSVYPAKIIQVKSKNIVLSLRGTNSNYTSTNWDRPYIIKIPTDGTKTGTYNNIVYSVSGFGVSSPSVTVTDVSAIENTPSYTVLDSASTPTNGDWTNILTVIP